MTRAEWERVRELFARAMDEAPGDVPAWLAREAPDAPSVRAEVESLLAHHAAAGRFIAAPAGETLAGLLAEERTLVPGQVLGAYTIVREAGRGGMGRVYLATDARLGRTVAIKALPPELTGDPAGRERLRREARAAAALSHPGICTVHALEEFDGELFIVTEFVDGHTLREEIESGTRPTARELLRTAREIADALASAHARHITHRDLKPENVMRTRDGRLKILDFGLARSDGPASDPIAVRVTQPAAVVGTPAYMAPEQLNGQPVDARADVFAFGVLIYEYASGVHPFEGPTPLAILARVLEGDPEPIERRVKDVPRAVRAVVARCLRKRPLDRFASAAGIVAALAGTDTEPVRPRAVGWWRVHQVVAIAMYLLASGLAWQAKEWDRGMTAVVFIAVGLAATVAAVFRGHLLFTERVNEPALPAERARARSATLFTDLLIACGLALDGLILAPGRPVAAVLILALGAGIVLARLLVESATTAAAFPPPSS